MRINWPCPHNQTLEKYQLNWKHFVTIWSNFFIESRRQKHKKRKIVYTRSPNQYSEISVECTWWITEWQAHYAYIDPARVYITYSSVIYIIQLYMMYAKCHCQHSFKYILIFVFYFRFSFQRRTIHFEVSKRQSVGVQRLHILHEHTRAVNVMWMYEFHNEKKKQKKHTQTTWGKRNTQTQDHGTCIRIGYTK